MTLDEAIERYTSNAEYERTHENLQGCLEFRQLAEWLKDYKRLLEQQPKTGHWVDRFPAKECKCSVCDFLICISNGSYIDMVGQMKYCPNCGAKMVEPQEIHCNYTDEEIAKSFIEDVEAVKDLLPIAESEESNDN